MTDHSTLRTHRLSALALLPLGLYFLPPLASTDVQLPGTQPGQVSGLGYVQSCDACHGQYDPTVEPVHQWRGSPMAHAARDPLFWAALAVAEQDFPGAGDFCLRCHTPRGWLGGRATPSDGSALSAADVHGVECAVCHAMVNPDDSEHVGVQSAPYLAHDGGTPKRAFTGSGMAVFWPGAERHGPYGNNAYHPALQSQFVRKSEMCGTCHDVSNPVTGDLAHNNGAQVPLPAGQFSGQLGAPVTQKAAFKNFPFQYGVVERTFSEAKAAALETTRVNALASLPAELQQGALKNAYDAAMRVNATADYADGTPRYFSCQTCHMPPVQAQGCAFAAPRTDMPLHSLVGGNTWIADAILHQDTNNSLRFGGGLQPNEVQGLRDGQARARAMLESAGALRVQGDRLRVVNLTGHKLISGYPEGRRMWLNVQWLDEAGNPLREDGAYGTLNVQLFGQTRQVATLLDLSGANTRIYEVKLGITRQWAQQLLALGSPASLPITYDRVTGLPTKTLGQLANQALDVPEPTFHFVLNNTVVADNRIPAYGTRYDDARARNILPVPASQFGNPGPGGVYDYFDDVPLHPPQGAAAARVRLMYQVASYEYVQFLALANNGSSAFLGQEGRNLLDTWFATGMAAPHPMASTAWCRLRGTDDDVELRSSLNGGGDELLPVKRATGGEQLQLTLASPRGALQGGVAVLLFQAHPTGQAPTPVSLPGFQLGRADGVLPLGALPQGGAVVTLPVPIGFPGNTVRIQGVVVSSAARNGSYATTCAHDVVLR